MMPMTISIPALQTYCNVEVRYCCRTRPVTSAYCQQFVTGAIGASCETAITCIRIPKQCVSNTPNSQPIQDVLVRQQIYYAVLEQLICANPCQHGLPGPSEQPYEWIFSMPACVKYLKTGDPMSAFCLSSCGSKYCVYAFKVIESPDPDYRVRVLEAVAVTWSSATPPYCAPYSTGCVTEDCDTEYRPSCSDWEYN